MMLRGLAAAALALILADAASADPFQDGITAAQRGEYTKAAQLWQPLADAGMPNAQNNLGSLYARGMGVAKDPVHAFQLYQTAANQGLADAENNLGFAYETGIGVQKDMGAAAKWYQSAADQGNALGELNIGLFYVNGTGVQKDAVTAFMWLGLANVQGLSGALSALSALIPNMTADQINEGRQRQIAWQLRAEAAARN